MDGAQIERRKMVTLPQEEFEAILERAAERGARHALHEVGLDGEDAAHDIRELRNLLDAFNEAKKTAGLTIIEPDEAYYQFGAELPPMLAMRLSGKKTMLIRVRFFSKTFMLLFTMVPRASMRPLSTEAKMLA